MLQERYVRNLDGAKVNKPDFNLRLSESDITDLIRDLIGLYLPGLRPVDMTLTLDNLTRFTFYREQVGFVEKELDSAKVDCVDSIMAIFCQFEIKASPKAVVNLVEAVNLMMEEYKA